MVRKRNNHPRCACVPLSGQRKLHLCRPSVLFSHYHSCTSTHAPSGSRLRFSKLWRAWNRQSSNHARAAPWPRISLPPHGAAHPSTQQSPAQAVPCTVLGPSFPSLCSAPPFHPPHGWRSARSLRLLILGCPAPPLRGACGSQDAAALYHTGRVSNIMAVLLKTALGLDSRTENHFHRTGHYV